MYKVKFANIMEMLYSFWSDKILVGILKKVCCNNAVVSNILNVFFACFLLFSTLTVMNVHSIIKLLSHWKVTFGFELFYCTRNYSGVNSFVKFYIIHFSMISNVCRSRIFIVYFWRQVGCSCIWKYTCCFCACVCCCPYMKVQSLQWYSPHNCKRQCPTCL